MKQRVITGTLFTVIIFAFVGPGFFQPWIICLMMFLISVIATKELTKAIETKDLQLGVFFPYWGIVVSLIPVAAFFFSDSLLFSFSIYTFCMIFSSILAVVFTMILHKRETAFHEGIATAGVILYISFPAACVYLMLLFSPVGWYIFAAGLFVPWISDVFAFFTGYLFGKHKVVPHISPKKTWEGCIGGVIGSALFTAIYFSAAASLTTFFAMKKEEFGSIIFISAAIVLGVILSILSQLGDWTASSIKRWSGIKDFGHLLPGHGGVIDRFDSAFFTLPAVFALVLFLQ